MIEPGQSSGGCTCGMQGFSAESHLASCPMSKPSIRYHVVLDHGALDVRAASPAGARMEALQALVEDPSLLIVRRCIEQP